MNKQCSQVLMNDVKGFSTDSLLELQDALLRGEVENIRRLVGKELDQRGQEASRSLRVDSELINFIGS